MSLSSRDLERLVAELTPVAARIPGLRLLVLHGSRARGEAHRHSDWDFAYEADASFDPDSLLAVLTEKLAANDIDLVCLTGAGALLRYRAARDGVVVFERDAGSFLRFWFNAVDTWCDFAPILQPLYEQVLAELAK